MLGRIITALIGLGVAAAGVYFLGLEMQQATAHKEHIYVFGGMLFAGGALAALPVMPPAVFDRVVVIVRTVIPQVTWGAGGRRAGDLPAPPPDPVDKDDGGVM